MHSAEHSSILPGIGGLEHGTMCFDGDQCAGTDRIGGMIV